LRTLPDGLNRLITHPFGLSDSGLALDAVGSSDCIKAIVIPRG